jgi:AcrR family transcriptional regulator
MSAAPVGPRTSQFSQGTGLRDRKKARRRTEIMTCARDLFAEKGLDATTMAEIADGVGVSPPTIFNYFGNKDGILIALITDGTAATRSAEGAMEPRTDADFCTILVDIFTRISERTLAIASKRVWRYAEAAAIRHPTTDLARQYTQVNRHLVDAVIALLERYDLRMAGGAPADPAFLGQLLFDVWSPPFYTLIRDEARDLEQHARDIRDRMQPLLTLLFDKAFLDHPTLKQRKGRA